MNVAIPCQIAKEYLEDSQVQPINACSPPGSASFYIPARKIKALFEDDPCGLTTRILFLCPCAGCITDGGSVEYRSDRFSKLKQRELEGEYALLYALLIYVRRPSLIQKFQKHEIKLKGTKYLCDSDFDKLQCEGISGLELAQRKILQYQYSFLVRTIRPASDIISIPAEELLPIKEDIEPKGEGTFAEVRCFEFQDNEYRSRDFGEHITRFARKIFRHGMQKSAAKEWYNLQRLSREEDHPHLMVALGAYWHGSYFFILQEEAEQSLHDYLNEPGDKFESRELWTQMQGIAEGLSTIHKLYKGTKMAYHQDLNPANILIVKRKLKIADFGLLELGPVTLTGIPKYVTGLYAAPCQAKYTQDCDIWSLACIMSEVATFDIHGPEGVSHYKNARMADGVSGRDPPRFFRGQQVKEAVLLMHTQLYDHVQSATSTDANSTAQFQKAFYNREFFELLDKMLRRGRVSAELLEVPDEGIPPDAAHVVETLEKLRKEALPTTALHDRGEPLEMEQYLQDVESLGSAMEAQFTGFGEMLNRENRARFSTTTLTALKQYIVNLQHTQHVERRQRGLARLGPFLERFSEFGEFIATLPSVGEIMGFIWGPVRFLLERTDSRTDAFNEILDIYGQIAKAQPSMSMYKELFQIEPDTTKILIATYSDIIHINQLLVVYFQQRLWTELLTITWRRHKCRLTSIISLMMSRLKFVASRAELDHFDSYMNTSAFETEASVAALDSENLSRKHVVYAWIRPTDVENDQEYLRRIRVAYPGTCSWILNDMAFQEWFKHQENIVTVPNLLWLNGKPGSGKTVLASFIVEEARKLESNPTVLFFYFKKEDSDRNNFLSMARTLLSQILQQSPYILDYLYSKCCSSGNPVLTSRSLVEELLMFALSNCESAYIILDGLDECCTRQERGDIASWFRDLIETGRPEIRDSLHCMFVSRHDSARNDYRDLPSITADVDNNKEDIETLCKVQAGNLVTNLQITEDQAHEIVERVSAAAEGIILFAQSVWVNLCEQSSIFSLERELESFATDLNSLDKVYARIMQTIMEKPVTAQRDEALLLLGWLVVAKRPLKMHEVQTLRSIDFNKGVVDFERRRFRVHPKDLCESLIDVRSDGSIELVHITARTYLAKSQFFHVTTEELQMATLCIDYLNLPSFQSPSEERVLAGEYGFMEYSVGYWLRHLEAGMIPAPPDQKNIYQSLTKSLETLVEQYWNDPTTSVASVTKSASKRTRDVLQQFSHHQSFRKIQLALVLTDSELEHFGNVLPGDSALRIASVVKAVRSCIETCVLRSSEPDVEEALRNMYGSNLFKCPRFSCRYFTDGFSTLEEREKHVARHERPARCTDEYCRGSQIGFATQAQLDRHLKENHPDTTERHHNFPTDEEILDSMREVSPESEAAIMDESKRNHDFPTDEETNASMREVSQEPKVTIKDDPERHQDYLKEEDIIHNMQGLSSGSKSAVAGELEFVPQLQQPPLVSDPAATRDSEQPEFERMQLEKTTKRLKTKREYQCAHCDKTFTKKYNWQSHLRTHGGNQRLQCPHCDRTCARQGDLARHMRLHNSDSAVTCGGVLSNGQTWGCGANFTRLDVLRTHHKSKKGRRCLAEREGEKKATYTTHMELDDANSESDNMTLVVTDHEDNSRPVKVGIQDKPRVITTMEEITPIVSAVLDMRKATGNSFAHTERLSFEIDWDLRSFLEGERYDTTISTALERAITITGTYEDAQALTCMEYMTKVWPETGCDTILALQAAVAQHSKEQPSCYTRRDGTELIVSFQPSTVLVQTHGTRAALAELCEQLAWLGSTFRSAPTSTEPCLVCPRIEKSLVETAQGSLSVWLILSFATFPATRELSAKESNSECWHKLFRNPTIVKGFPIEPRKHGERGLEISIDLLYTLAETRYATRYEHTLLLKGHCTLLVPTQRAGSSFVWHLLCSKDGKRIPYYKYRQQCTDWLHLNDLEVQQLDTEDARHFVGWTSNVNRYLGAEAVAYQEISYSGQKICKSGLALEQKATVSISRVVGISGSIVRGNRDKPEYFKYSDLRQQMESARGWFIVLYDSSDRRGWLTDGASALLHIVRTRLAGRPYDGCGSEFTNKHVKTSEFTHPSPDAGPDAAYHALMDENNQKYIVSRDFDSWSEEKAEPRRPQVLPAGMGDSATSAVEGSTDERKEIYKTTSFKQIVTQTYGILETIYDRERDMDSSHAIKELRSPLGTSIEGWEFMDFVRYKQTLTRRYHPLQSRGVAWADMMKRAHGIVLFGRNFGDLYKPAGSVCKPWKRVPQGHELLAAPVSLMQQMQQISFEDGEVEEGSNEVVKGIFWYPSTDMLSQCLLGCKHLSPHRLQHLARKRMNGCAQSKLGDLSGEGAVLFGGSNVFNGQLVDQLAAQSSSVHSLNSTIESSSSVSLSATSAAESDSASQTSQFASTSSATSPDSRQATEGQLHDGAKDDRIPTPFGRNAEHRVPSNDRKRRYEDHDWIQKKVNTLREHIAPLRPDKPTMARETP